MCIGYLQKPLKNDVPALFHWTVRPIYGTPMTKQSIVISGHSMQCILSVDVDIVFWAKWESIKLNKYSSNYKLSKNVI